MRIMDWKSDVCSADLPYSSTNSNRNGNYGRPCSNACQRIPGTSWKRLRLNRAHRLPNACGGSSLFRSVFSLRNRRYIRSWPMKRISDLIGRSEEHTSELQSLMRISYAVFCLKKKTTKTNNSCHHAFKCAQSTKSINKGARNRNKYRQQSN